MRWVQNIECFMSDVSSLRYQFIIALDNRDSIIYVPFRSWENCQKSAICLNLIKVWVTPGGRRVRLGEMEKRLGTDRENESSQVPWLTVVCHVLKIMCVKCEKSRLTTLSFSLNEYFALHWQQLQNWGLYWVYSICWSKETLHFMAFPTTVSKSFACLFLTV